MGSSAISHEYESSSNIYTIRKILCKLENSSENIAALYCNLYLLLRADNKERINKERISSFRRNLGCRNIVSSDRQDLCHVYKNHSPVTFFKN